MSQHSAGAGAPPWLASASSRRVMCPRRRPVPTAAVQVLVAPAPSLAGQQRVVDASSPRADDCRPMMQRRRRRRDGASRAAQLEHCRVVFPPRLMNRTKSSYSCWRVSQRSEWLRNDLDFPNRLAKRWLCKRLFSNLVSYTASCGYELVARLRHRCGERLVKTTQEFHINCTDEAEPRAAPPCASYSAHSSSGKPAPCWN